MIARYVILIVSLLAAGPALAESLNADAARVSSSASYSRSIVSMARAAPAASTATARSSAPSSSRARDQSNSVQLPAGTLKMKGEAVCASLKGIAIEPCFDLNRTDDQSFRGSVSGLRVAYWTSPAA